MSNILLTRLACTLALALCALSVRADELSDWQPVGSELIATRKLSLSTSWEVPQLRTAYQKIAIDLETYQAAYPHPQHGADLHGLIFAIRRYVEILAWEQATVSTPDDPHGMKNVIAHLQALYQKGKIAETAGKWQEASESYSTCCGYWVTIWELYPQWRPAFVAEQKRLCEECYIAMFEKIWWKKNPYFDPKLHTLLSV
jgi:hypothetical protein